MRKLSGVLIALLILSSSFIIPFQFLNLSSGQIDQVQAYEIIDDKVVLNDSKVYFDASPHTLMSSGYVTFNLISKVYTGDIDIAIGFSDQDVKPEMPDLWRNYSHTLFRWVSVNQTREEIFRNVSGYWPQIWNETVKPDIGNRFNKYLYLVNGADKDGGSYSLLVAFNSFQFLGGDIQVTYTYTGRDKEYYESWFYDWKNINLDISKEQYDFKGKDRWYYTAKGSPIISNLNYTFRIWINIPFSGLDKYEGEYYIAFKPSFQTIGEAISSGNFYYLDPWWNSSWTYARQLTFDNSGQAENLDNFPVLVNLTSSNFDFSHAESDGSDIRFIDSDNSTELAYEREEYNSTSEQAYIWVNVPRINVSSAIDHIFLYYGNAGAADGENITGTWNPNYRMVQHMVDNSTSTILDSTSNDNDGTKDAVNEPIEIDSLIFRGQDYDAVDDRITVSTDSSLNQLAPITMSAWINPDGWGEPNSGYILHQRTGSEVFIYFISNSNNGTRLIQDTASPDFASWASDNNGITLGVWQWVTVVYNRTLASDDPLFYINGVVQNTTELVTGGVPNFDTAPWYIGNRPAEDRTFNGTLEEVRIRNTSDTAGWIAAQYLSMTDDFITFGAEGTESPITPLLFYLTSLFHSGISNIDVNGTQTSNLTETAINDTEIALGVANAESGFRFLYWDNENVSHIHDITVTKTMTANSTVTAFAIAVGGDGGVAGVSMLLFALLVGFAVIVLIVASRKR